MLAFPRLGNTPFDLVWVVSNIYIIRIDIYLEFIESTYFLYRVSASSTSTFS